MLLGEDDLYVDDDEPEEARFLWVSWWWIVAAAFALGLAVGLTASGVI